MTEATVTLRPAIAGQAPITFKMDLDLEFPSDQVIADHINKQTCYEPDVAWVMMRALRVGDRVVDVGACVGFFTLLAAALVGPIGEVTAVEPGDDNLPRLMQNLTMNGLGNQVRLVPNPLFARAEPVRFHLNADSSGGHALWNPGAWHENAKTRKYPQAVEMLATTLNRIAPSPCRLIKIDTEGAEERILQGANNVLAVQHPPFIIAELNAFGLQQMMCSPDSLRAYMRVHGYDTFGLHHDGAYPELVPPRKAITCEHVFNVLFSSPTDVASVWK